MMLETIAVIAIIGLLVFFFRGLSRIEPMNDSEPPYGAD